MLAASPTVLLPVLLGTVVWQKIAFLQVRRWTVDTLSWWQGIVVQMPPHWCQAFARRVATTPTHYTTPLPTSLEKRCRKSVGR